MELCCICDFTSCFFHSYILLCGAIVHSLPLPYNILVHPDLCISSTVEHLGFFQFGLLRMIPLRIFFEIVVLCCSASLILSFLSCDMVF